MSARENAAYDAAVARRLTLHTPAGGGIAFVAMPSQVPRYLDQIADVFAALGRPLGADSRAALGAALRERVAEGFTRSPYGYVRIDYATDADRHDAMSWTIHTIVPEADVRYTAEGNPGHPPRLEPVPDARVLALAATLGAPSDVTCLDAGAALGRNAIALARLGHPVDALEPLPSVAARLEERLAKEAPAARVVRGDLWDTDLRLPRARYRLVVCTEVLPKLRALGAVRILFRRLATTLDDGGAAILTLFVARDGYVPNPATRELGEALSCPVFPREELEVAAFGLGLEVQVDAPLVAYGREHEPAWPPAPWVEAWASGRDLFDLAAGEEPPAEARWVVVRRK